MSMRNLAIINIAGLSPLAYTPVFGGLSAFERVLEWAGSIPEASGVIFLAESETAVPEGTVEISSDQTESPYAPMRVIRRGLWTEELLIAALAEASKLPLSPGSEKESDERAEALFYVWGDSPLLDPKLTETLWKLHYKYDAEYTFSDGYPYGLAPEVLSAGLSEKLIPLAVGRPLPPARDSLFEVLRQDINAFDVETHLSPGDMRMDRVSITCDTRRNRNIAERLFSAGGVDGDSLCRLIPENRGLLRDRPAFFPVQITDHCPQACSYCPFPKAHGDPRMGTQFMDSGKFAELCENIVDFAGDAVIGLSLWGEPASHPEIGTLIRSALVAGNGRDTKVLIETSGIGWDEKLLRELAEETGEGRLLWIVSLDASDLELYKSLRGEGLEEAEKTARLCSELFGSYCWLQAVRMEENEEHLEFFYKKWKEEGVQVIVQKYDAYASYLPQRQPSDLSPLERFPCWHLKRDMPILIDGSVPVCRDDLGRSENLGNVFTESLENVWAAGDKLFKSHVTGEYPGPCSDCDEYYTFNF